MDQQSGQIYDQDNLSQMGIKSYDPNYNYAREINNPKLTLLQNILNQQIDCIVDERQCFNKDYMKGQQINVQATRFLINKIQDYYKMRQSLEGSQISQIYQIPNQIKKKIIKKCSKQKKGTKQKKKSVENKRSRKEQCQPRSCWQKMYNKIKITQTLQLIFKDLFEKLGIAKKKDRNNPVGHITCVALKLFYQKQFKKMVNPKQFKKMVNPQEIKTQFVNFFQSIKNQHNQNKKIEQQILNKIINKITKIQKHFFNIMLAQDFQQVCSEIFEMFKKIQITNNKQYQGSMLDVFQKLLENYLYISRKELHMPDQDYFNLVLKFNRIRKVPKLIQKCLQLHIVNYNNQL